MTTKTSTTQFYEGATPEQLRHSLVREFLAIHDMFQRELDAMLRFVDALIADKQNLTGPETLVQMQTLAGAAFQYTQLLHFHHHGESSMLFPALREEGLAATVIDRLEAEHTAIARLIDQLDAAMRDLAAIDPNQVDADLRQLAKALRTHLAYEETHVCPVLILFSRWPMPNY